MQTATKKLPALIFTFLNIHPVNSVEEVTKGGLIDGFNPFITNTTVPISSPAKSAKTLHLVLFRRAIEETELEHLLRTEGKRPCENAPSFLLGFLKEVSEAQMPEVLGDCDIGALEPGNPSSFFSGKCGERCVLYVRRHDDGVARQLRLLVVDERFHGALAFLAEDLPA